MIDDSSNPNKMCDWETIELVAGATETLKALSVHFDIYIATGAAQSTELDIKKAFSRMHLHEYIDGYFCQQNLGIAKGSAAFLPAILNKLSISPSQAAMIGDNYTKDIQPALEAGLLAIWLSSNCQNPTDNGIVKINQLNELLTLPQLNNN